MRNFTIAIFLCMLTYSSIAQEDRHAKIKALKIGYLTEQLELSKQEAEIFWPIYNAYSDKNESIYREERSTIKKGRENFDTLTESEAKEMLSKLQSFENQKTSAHEKLLKDLDGKLSYKKTLKLIKAEGDFRKKLLHRLRDGKSKDKT